MKLGHYYDGDISRFRIFAPRRRGLEIVLYGEKGSEEERVELSRDELGYWQGQCRKLPMGTLYKIEVNGKPYPDPASKYQPQGVHGPSMVVNHTRAEASGWRGIRLEDAIIYELHLGTFTPEGNLRGAVKRLPYLGELGINVVELMPINAFPGQRNWGYDGTYPFALQESYGTYGDLKEFIEEAHSLGIAVILDVVYNHFGPEGNYSSVYAPYTKDAPTPWGAAINFDGAYNYGVREYFLENTRWWLEEIGFDGFRMDAVSLIFDNMPRHILREITDLAAEIAEGEGREILMIAEHLRNDRNVTSEEGFNYGSQWNDDLNHALYAKLTGEKGRHYINFGTLEDIEKALKEGFVMDGTKFDRYCKYFMGTEGSKTMGSDHVVHIQNHDQVGNRLHGDRMISTYGWEKALLGATAVMASPYIPMLFMGEEYGEEAPFLFFEDFSDKKIIDGAREGRKREYSFRGEEPRDPHYIETFEDSKLRWETLEERDNRGILEYYRKLIALKKSGRLGPVDRDKVRVILDSMSEIIKIQSPHTVTLLNFSHKVQKVEGMKELLLSSEKNRVEGRIGAFGAQIYKR